jgi:hypothetical protein
LLFVASVYLGFISRMLLTAKHVCNRSPSAFEKIRGQQAS